jgi:hypothetical protein
MAFLIHYSLHFLLPAALALLIDRKKWIKLYLIFLAAMLIDIDHLIANPVFESCRCSIGFHPLHSYQAIVFYFLLLIHPRTRMISLGLLLHILADSADCLLMKSNC